LNSLETQALSSLATDIASVLMLAFGPILVFAVSFKSCADFQDFPKYLVVYYTYLLFPSSSCCFLVFLYYLKNPQLKQALVRGLRNIFVRN
jgi:hypothetical protein